MEDIIKEIIEKYEGGYVNNPNDPGGETKYGITKKVAIEYGYEGDMKELPIELAIQIYKQNYFIKYKLHKLNNKNIQREVFKFGINAGMKKSIKLLQRAYNTLQKNNFLKEDGIIGNHTINLINNYKYPEDLLKVYKILEGYYYIIITENDKKAKKIFLNHKPSSNKLKTFIRGWIRRVFD